MIRLESFYVTRSTRLTVAASLLIIAVSSGFARGQTGPVPDTEFGMHINNHALPNSSQGSDPYPPAEFTFHALRLHDAGVTWAEIETAQGVYDWTRLDDWVQLAQSKGFDLMLTVEDTPQWASSDPSRTSCQYSQYGQGGCAMPANIQDYIDFVTAVVTRYKGQIAYYEGWNEANTGWVAPGARTTITGAPYFVGTAQDLVMLQQNLYQIVKSVDPAAQVSSPPFTDLQQGITDVNTLLQNGACSYFDIMGFHYYTQGAPPETIPSLVTQISQALSSHGCGTKPLWDTEIGWPKPTSFPDFSAPGFLARTYLLGWNAGLQRQYWYAYNNQTFDAFFLDNPFNYLNAAGLAYPNVESWMIGSTFSGCSQSNDGVYTCTATDPNGHLEWFVWYAASSVDAGNTQISFAVPESWNAADAMDINGNRVPAAGNVWIGPDPIRFTTASLSDTNSASVSTASYSGTAVAPSSLVATFGQGLASTTTSASTVGSNLAGTTVSITDSSGASFTAMPLFVSPGQVNFYLPAGLAAGTANVIITSADGHQSKSTVVISPVAPGIYLEGSLQGAPAAQVLHYNSEGQLVSSSFAFSCSGSYCTSTPIDVSAPDQTVSLTLYGTGFRNASSVQVQILGNVYPVTFSGAQGTDLGLDQINVVLPSSLAHSGTVPLLVIADTQISNTVQITIQ
jgi:uncharacterized protein (TIGR03437 family)